MTGSAVGVSFRPGELEVHPDGSGNLKGSHCLSCGAHFFPIRQACAACLSDDLEAVGFSTTGSLYTYTVVRQSTPAFEVPYMLGYVDFPEGVRIMGQISGCTEDEIQIGMPMTLILEPVGVDEKEDALIGYKFRPGDVTDD